MPIFYVGPESHHGKTGCDRLIMTCVVLLTLVWSGTLIWLATSIGIISAHFVAALIPPTLPFRPTL